MDLEMSLFLRFNGSTFIFTDNSGALWEGFCGINVFASQLFPLLVYFGFLGFAKLLNIYPSVF